MKKARSRGLVATLFASPTLLPTTVPLYAGTLHSRPRTLGRHAIIAAMVAVARCKHLDLRDMLVREHHQRGLTEPVSIPTDFQLADPLTKVLAEPAVTKFRVLWAGPGALSALRN